MQKKQDTLLFNLKRLQSTLIESIREGILLIPGTLQPIYLNLKAREFYDRLWDSNLPSTQLPPILSNISHQLFNGFHSDHEPLIVDHQVSPDQTIRIRACPFTPRIDQAWELCCDRQYILVFLEDRNATLAEELKVEQKKYDLTERETQLLRLLLQAYSYQDIARTLQN